jgi:predicted KAP-like P-loop ATPase
MQTSSNSASIRGERALREGEVDRLGFKEVARRIAGSLADHASDDGFVVGIDGQWGSGKSSLLYLISSELQGLPPSSRPTVISFQPWLVGNRDALLASLFNQLVAAIAKVQLENGDASNETWRRAKEAMKVARKFGKSVANAGEVIKSAPLGSQVKIVGSIVHAVGNFMSGEAKADLPKQKKALSEALRRLGHRFIVTVDDVDRLEPSEVVEVLRLVRSVADFPNIIYLLCYDSAVLAESVKRGANVPDGAAFLEKIVQLTVMVPRPEPFQLRQWFGDEVGKITGTMADDVVRRLRSVIDQEGGVHLQTPRAVVRSLDSLRFFWPALKAERIDIPDLVWLLLIKDGNPKLYRWIESYLGGAAVISTGMGTVQDAARVNELRSLKEIAGSGYFDDLMYRSSFAEALPGVVVDYGKEGEAFKLYQRVNDVERDKAIAGRRLASPDHFRLYLALMGPAHAITQHQAEEIWKAATQSAEDAGNALLTLSEQFIASELSKADLFLERLAGSASADLTPVQAQHLLLAFSQVMDELDRSGSDSHFMIFTTWDRAERVVARMLRRAGADARGDLIDRMFRDGIALGWLSSLLRRETFAQGRYGDQRKPENEWILSREEYDRVAALMVARFKSLSLRDIVSRSRPLTMLFAWAQAGDPDGPKALFAKETRDDEGLLSALTALITAVDSSDRGRYETLQLNNVEPFMDYQLAIARVKAIKAKNLSAQGATNLVRVQVALKAQRSRYENDGDE